MKFAQKKKLTNMAIYHCKKFCGQTADFICSRCAVKEATDEQLLAELEIRKLKPHEPK